MVTQEKLEQLELDEEHEKKYRLRRWVEMLRQLRWGSPVAKDVLPGECQSMLDWLINREWPYNSEAPKLRHETHKLRLETSRVNVLYKALPKWADTERPPRSEKGYPIFYKHNDNLIYLDGRRRINLWYREDPKQKIQYWIISDEV